MTKLSLENLQEFARINGLTLEARHETSSNNINENNNVVDWSRVKSWYYVSEFEEDSLTDELETIKDFIEQHTNELNWEAFDRNYYDPENDPENDPLDNLENEEYHSMY